MVQLANKKWTDGKFSVGDCVFLKLQPYKQQTVAFRAFGKLAAKYYGPFQIIAKVDEVAYTLKLLEGAQIHPTFNVSLLKKAYGDSHPSSTIPLDLQTPNLKPISVAILDREMVQRRPKRGPEDTT